GLLASRVRVARGGPGRTDRRAALLLHVPLLVGRKFPLVLPAGGARLVQLTDALLTRRDLLGASGAKGVRNRDLLRLPGPLFHGRDLEDAVQVEAHPAEDLVRL